MRPACAVDVLELFTPESSFPTASSFSTMDVPSPHHTMCSTADETGWRDVGQEPCSYTSLYEQSSSASTFEPIACHDYAKSNVGIQNNVVTQDDAAVAGDTAFRQQRNGHADDDIFLTGAISADQDKDGLHSLDLTFSFLDDLLRPA